MWSVLLCIRKAGPIWIFFELFDIGKKEKSNPNESFWQKRKEMRGQTSKIFQMSMLMSPMNKTESLRCKKKSKAEMRSNVYSLRGSYDLQAG